MLTRPPFAHMGRVPGCHPERVSGFVVDQENHYIPPTPGDQTTEART
jgi:hypothetical protein